MSSLKLDGVDPKFILKRIVLINSGGHAYSEILLDDHMAMFGSNNVGKTASLAATKLLLFPENSLAKCETKFRFEGDKGSYKGEESHKFYFPTDTSFLALEVENPSGSFCMVLYKPSASSATTRLDYNRVFIPKTYESLRPIFWNEEQGDFASSLSVASLLEYSKKNNGKEVLEIKRLVEIMFGSFGTADGRFCILPLKDCGTESINAFRDIFNLAFASSNADKVILPSAISALIEMQRGRDEERLNSTLNVEYEKFLQLVRKRDELENREANADRFLSFHDKYHVLSNDIEKYSKNYHALAAWLGSASETHAPKVQANLKQFELVEGEFKTAHQKLTQLNHALIGTKAQRDGKFQDLSKLNNKIRDCQKIIGRYPEGHDLNLILELHCEDEKKIRDTLQALTTKEENARILQEKNTKLKLKCVELANVNAKLTQQSSLLMTQIDSHSNQVFEILNPNLNSIFQVINDQDKETIASFTNLFSFDVTDRTFYFKTSRLDGFVFSEFDAKKQTAILLTKQSSLLNEINLLEESIEALKGYLIHADNKQYTENEKKNLNQDLAKCLQDIKLLESYKTLNIQLPEIEQEFNDLETALAQLNIEIESEKQVCETLDTRRGELRSISQQLQSLNDSFDQIQNALKYAFNETLLIPKIHMVPLEDDIQALPHGVHAILKISDSLMQVSKSLLNEHYSFKDEFKKFMIDVPEPSIEAHVESPSMQATEVNITIYANIFGTLEFQRKDFNNAVISHNKAIRAQIDEIGDARAQLTRQINLINQKLNGHRISNLSNIQLKLETHSDFDALNHTLVKFNISGDTLPEKAFYESLLKFFEKNQNTNNGRLKMVNLIKSISYQYSKNDGRVENASQSKGTTNTINAFVLSILLSEIKQADMRVHLPIIVDEIAALDAANSQAAITQISEQGFSIFCATPEFNAHIAECVGQYIFIDQNRPTNVMIDSCQLHILPRHVNRFGEVNEA